MATLISSVSGRATHAPYPLGSNPCPWLCGNPIDSVGDRLAKIMWTSPAFVSIHVTQSNTVESSRCSRAKDVRGTRYPVQSQAVAA